MAATSEVPISFGILRASHSPTSSACLVDLVLAAIQATITLLAFTRFARSLGSSSKLSLSNVSKSFWSLAKTASNSTLVTPMW